MGRDEGSLSHASCVGRDTLAEVEHLKKRDFDANKEHTKKQAKEVILISVEEETEDLNKCGIPLKHLV